VGGQTGNGAKRSLERRAKWPKERAKRKAALVVSGALSLVLSLDEQRKNKNKKNPGFDSGIIILYRCYFLRELPDDSDLFESLLLAAEL